jgi:rfaE bifunctional protein nucleotidyltransferase chain/domain
MKSWSECYQKKVIDPLFLKERCEAVRSEHKTIVTLNGSFDLMHAGHLEMIWQAKHQGDFLIVALNTDSSIQRYKSKNRPIVPLEFRLQMMAALSFVDAVTWFDETDPRELLSIIRPDVHVNGPEWGENCIERDVVVAHGGKIHIVDKIPGLSTSEIIRRVQCA